MDREIRIDGFYSKIYQVQAVIGLLQFCLTKTQLTIFDKTKQNRIQSQTKENRMRIETESKPGLNQIKIESKPR
jgi:hypothetical protein